MSPPVPCAVACCWLRHRGERRTDRWLSGPAGVVTCRSWRRT